MRNKSILSVLVIIVFYIIVALLCSCNKDNPTNPIEPPPPPPDTASRYIWTAQQIYATLTNLYVADSNKVYIIENDALILHTDSTSSAVIYDPTILVKNVYGYDKNNIIVVGFKYRNGNYLPAIFKITNGSMQTFVYENECDISFDLLVTGPNQAWISSFCESKVYYFDNGNLTTYRLNNNDTIKCGIFYKDINNNLFVFLCKLPTFSKDTLYTYKYNGTNFELLRTDFIDSYHPEGKSHNIARCGTDAIMIPSNHNKKQFYFNGNEWVMHSLPLDTIKIIKVGGISKDSLFALMSPEYSMYIYSNAKWRKENRSPHFKGGVDLFTNIEVKFGNVYLTSCDFIHRQGWILIGKPNKSHYYNK